jgi:hypothetical protein
VRETDTTYDPAVGLPATVTTVMTPAATIVQTHIYDDTTGNVTDSVQPGGTAGGQGDRKTIYYGPDRTRLTRSAGTILNGQT